MLVVAMKKVMLLLLCVIAQAQQPNGVRVRSYDHGKIEWTDLATGKDYASTCAAKVTVYYPTLFAVNSKTCELLGPTVAGKSILSYAPGTGVVVVFTTPTLVFRIDLPDRSIIETFTPGR